MSASHALWVQCNLYYQNNKTLSPGRNSVLPTKQSMEVLITTAIGGIVWLFEDSKRETQGEMFSVE